jgi:hypothetical protein
MNSAGSESARQWVYGNSQNRGRQQKNARRARENSQPQETIVLFFVTYQRVLKVLRIGIVPEYDLLFVTRGR